MQREQERSDEELRREAQRAAREAERERLLLESPGTEIRAREAGYRVVSCGHP